MEESPRLSVPRGRHAPPLEVRLDLQRVRLFEAAARVFARVGYAEASAEAIARDAGMSKATFYEHFSNKEECIIALFDRAAEIVLAAMAEAAQAAGTDPVERMRAGTRAFLLRENPEAAQAIADRLETARRQGLWHPRRNDIALTEMPAGASL